MGYYTRVQDKEYSSTISGNSCNYFKVFIWAQETEKGGMLFSILAHSGSLSFSENSSSLSPYTLGLFVVNSSRQKTICRCSY